MTISDFFSSNMANFAHLFQKNPLYISRGNFAHIVTTVQNFAQKKTLLKTCGANQLTKA
jgi:hypothetical protein